MQNCTVYDNFYYNEYLHRIEKLNDENINLVDQVQMLKKIVKLIADVISIEIPFLSRQSNKPIANTDQSDSKN